MRKFKQIALLGLLALVMPELKGETYPDPGRNLPKTEIDNIIFTESNYGCSFYFEKNTKTAERVTVVQDASSHPKFINELPVLPKIDATSGGLFELEMEQSEQWLGLVGENNEQINTTVWGYSYNGAEMYLGPTFETRTGQPVDIRWKNDLPFTHLLPIDETIHRANPSNGIPTVTHLHGGHVESASDGGPDSWFTQGFAEKGAEWVKEIYHYENDQEGAPLWYHDHALGMTRLNVYAGLSGMYLLRDENELSLDLPSGDYERELIIQDKQFSGDGTFYFPALLSDPEADDFPTNPAIEPTIFPEFFGDYILVNGMAWPKLNVEATKYRFRLLNASDSRFYIFELSNGGSFIQVGSEGGLLNNPVSITQIILAPGERVDVVVDFSTMAEESVVLRNNGPDEPFKGLAANQAPADPNSTGVIMRFDVGTDSNASFTIPNNLRAEPIQGYGDVVFTRQLLLLEGMDQFGRLKPSLGTAQQGQIGYTEPVTETPLINTTEIWEVYNNTEDAHPVHIHQISFEVLNKQEFTGDLDPETSVLSNIQLVGPTIEPDLVDQGWKDTYIVPPGQVARFKVRFDIPGRYVWHCHILSHEDWDMMRPFDVVTEECVDQGGDTDGDGICNEADNCQIDDYTISNITCNNNNTPNDPKDDFFTFLMTVEGQGAGWSGGGQQGAFGESLEMGPYQIYFGDLNFDLQCLNGIGTLGVNVVAPAACSTLPDCNYMYALIKNDNCCKDCQDGNLLVVTRYETEPDNNPRNVALGKPSVMSSRSFQFATNAGYAVDDNLATETRTAEEMNPWWETDLAGYYDLSQIVLEGTTGGMYRVLISNSPFTSFDLNAAIAQATTSLSNSGGTIDVNTTGRYIRIYREGVGVLELSDVIVLGTSTSNTDPFTYIWNPASIGSIRDPQCLSPGTYQVTVRDAGTGCELSDDIIVE